MNTRPTPSVVADEGLLPCPFCGCKTVRQFHPFEQRGYVIDCNRCNGGFHNIPKDQAVKRWNARVAASDRDVLVGRIAELQLLLAEFHRFELARLKREGKSLPATGVAREMHDRTVAALVPLGVATLDSPRESSI